MDGFSEKPDFGNKSSICTMEITDNKIIFTFIPWVSTA